MTINDGVRSTTGYTVTGLASGTRYYFRVFAHNAVGNSASSTVVSAVPRTVVTVPGAVSYFDVYADYVGLLPLLGRPGEHRRFTDHELRRPGVRLRLRLRGTRTIRSTPRGDSAYAIRSPGYGCGTFRIAAVNAVGVGPYSAPVEACYWGYAAQDAAHVEGSTKVVRPASWCMRPA